MKSLSTGTILATILSSSTITAFTSPKSQPQLSRPTSLVTKLQSTLADDVDLINPQSAQQLTEEEQLQSNVSQEDVDAIEASFEASSESKSYLDDGFVFGLDGSGLDRPKGKVANIVVEGDGVETTPLQLATVSATFAGHAYFAVSSILNLLAQTDGNIEVTALTSLTTILASWVLADLGSGVLHWSVDNYGNGRTPIMGNIIAAFQGHHSAPWTITQRGFCNNVWKLCIPFGVPTVGAITYLAGSENPMVSLFFAVFCFNEIMSQELHKWSHMTKKEVPEWVNKIQDLGISIGRVAHAKHHMAPYDGNYCIVSGVCNEALDNSGFFRWMEHKVYDINGIEANSWKLDPELKAKTLRGEYALTK